MSHDNAESAALQWGVQRLSRLRPANGPKTGSMRSAGRQATPDMLQGAMERVRDAEAQGQDVKLLLHDALDAHYNKLALEWLATAIDPALLLRLGARTRPGVRCFVATPPKADLLKALQEYAIANFFTTDTPPVPISIAMLASLADAFDREESYVALEEGQGGLPAGVLRRRVPPPLQEEEKHEEVGPPVADDAQKMIAALIEITGRQREELLRLRQELELFKVQQQELDDLSEVAPTRAAPPEPVEYQARAWRAVAATRAASVLAGGAPPPHTSVAMQTRAFYDEFSRLCLLHPPRPYPLYPAEFRFNAGGPYAGPPAEYVDEYKAPEGGAPIDFSASLAMAFDASAREARARKDNEKLKSNEDRRQEMFERLMTAGKFVDPVGWGPTALRAAREASFLGAKRVDAADIFQQYTKIVDELEFMAGANHMKVWWQAHPAFSPFADNLANAVHSLQMQGMSGIYWVPLMKNLMFDFPDIRLHDWCTILRTDPSYATKYYHVPMLRKEARDGAQSSAQYRSSAPAATRGAKRQRESEPRATGGQGGGHAGGHKGGKGGGKGGGRGGGKGGAKGKGGGSQSSSAAGTPQYRGHCHSRSTTSVTSCGRPDTAVACRFNHSCVACGKDHTATECQAMGTWRPELDSVDGWHA